MFKSNKIKYKKQLKLNKEIFMKEKLWKDLSQGNIFSDMSKVSKNFLWNNKNGLMLPLSYISIT